MVRSRCFVRWRNCSRGQFPTLWTGKGTGSLALRDCLLHVFLNECGLQPTGIGPPRSRPPNVFVTFWQEPRLTNETCCTHKNEEADMIQFKREICGDLETALPREWLETNGLGGFASSTIIGLNTRRYHGLLVAATKPPVGRLVLLSKLEETFFIEGQAFELSANRYPGVVHPQGFRYLKQFRLDPFPVFTYEVEGIEIEKSVFMIQGENSTVVHYELKKNNHPESPKNLWLELRPLIAFRDYHSTTHENGAINRDVEERSG